MPEKDDLKRRRARFPAQRTVVHADSLRWMAHNPARETMSVVTSLPDLSEVPQLGLEGWCGWFQDAARQVFEWTPAPGVAIFFQSDIRHQGAWIDKGQLLKATAFACGYRIVWRKIVCRLPPGTISSGRPTFAEMICFSRGGNRQIVRPGPDVIADGGKKAWTRAMGETAIKVACRFLVDETETEIVVDPFCGVGTALAVANSYGLAALGIELSAQRCRRALGLQVSDPFV